MILFLELFDNINRFDLLDLLQYVRVIRLKKNTRMFLKSGWLVEFYSISTSVGYLKSNPFLCK